jgi:hypothetical protein
MNFKKDYKLLIEGLSEFSNKEFYLTNSQLTNKEVGAFLADSLLCIADFYMKKSGIGDSNLTFDLIRGQGNLSPFPLTAYSKGDDAPFYKMAPFVSYVFDEHVLPYSSEVEVCFQLSGFILKPDFELSESYPELVTRSSDRKQPIFISNINQDTEVTNGRSL